MLIDAHIIVWQREDTIHLTIKHYQKFCRDVYIYDNWSTDRTREIAEKMGCRVTSFGIAGTLDDQAYIQVKNNCWKGSTADWVIVVDDDEIFVSLDGFEKDATILHPKGFSTFSNDMPKEEWLELQSGVIDHQYSKLCCFNPKEITEIGFVYGCHEAKPRGNVKIEQAGFLFHYRAVGGAERLIERHLAYCRKKWGYANERWNLAHHYRDTQNNPDQTRKWFQEHLEKSAPLF